MQRTHVIITCIMLLDAGKRFDVCEKLATDQLLINEP
jgi:hypothetical protein